MKVEICLVCSLWVMDLNHPIKQHKTIVNINKRDIDGSSMVITTVFQVKIRLPVFLRLAMRFCSDLQWIKPSEWVDPTTFPAAPTGGWHLGLSEKYLDSGGTASLLGACNHVEPKPNWNIQNQSTDIYKKSCKCQRFGFWPNTCRTNGISISISYCVWVLA